LERRYTEWDARAVLEDAGAMLWLRRAAEQEGLERGPEFSLKLERLMHLANRMLDGCGSVEDAQVLRLRYIRRMPWNELMEHMQSLGVYYEPRNYYRMRKRGLRLCAGWMNDYREDVDVMMAEIEQSDVVIE